MGRAAFDGSTSADLFKAVLKKQQSDEVGRVVDDSLELAARLREERAERDRIEREAEERAERLRRFKELEAEDARKLREREDLEEEDARERELQHAADRKAQLIAEMRRRDELFA